MAGFSIVPNRVVLSDARSAIDVLSEFEAGNFEDYAYHIIPDIKDGSILGYMVEVHTATGNVCEKVLGYLRPVK